MPRRKSAPSLEELCLNMTTTRFEEKEMQDQLRNIPPTIINSVFERLCLKIECRRNYLPSKIFINHRASSLHHLDNFDLHPTRLYDRIGQICVNVVELNLRTYCEDLKVTTASTVKLLQSLPKLQRLIFRSECTDELAAVIGNNCSMLTYLNVQLSPNITDIGLQSLSRCVRLVFLDVTFTNATADRCLFVLNQLQVLKVFNHCCWNELFSKLAEQWKRNKTWRTYSLEKTTRISYEHILIVRNSFPNLRHLDFFTVGPNFDFDTLLWPQRLTNLHLDQVKSVSIRLIDRAWPMLKKLTLNKCTISNETDDIINAPLKNLRHLSLEYLPLITRQEVETLLAGRKSLETLELVDFPMELPLGLISQLVSLKYLVLYTCHSITPTSIMKLLEMRNPLTELSIWYCDEIDESTFVLIKRYVKRQKLDLDVIGYL